MNKQVESKRIEDTSNILVDHFAKNKTEEIITQLTWYKQTDLIDIRIWHRDKNDSICPTKKGITIRRELYPYLQRAVEKIGVLIEEMEGIGVEVE